MKEQLNRLLEFQRKFGSIHYTKPSFLVDDNYNLRYELLKEENVEYVEACKQKEETSYT